MTATTRFVPLLLLGSLAAPLGCSSGGNVNIGDTQSLGGKLSDYAAQWDGYAEAYTFQPSNSDHIHLVLDAQGNGTLQVGNDPLLPAPTNPDVGYPPGAPAEKASFATDSGLLGGVLYPVYAAQVEAGRIQFGLKPLDYYGAWCALQTPYHVLSGYHSNSGAVSGLGGFFGGTDAGWVPDYGYFCIPGASGGESGTSDNPQCTVDEQSLDGSVTTTPVDCGKFYLCETRVCACTATSCIASPTVPDGTSPAGYPAELDGALDSSGKALTGTLNIKGTRITVHLARK
ncbi:MAG TPA: hypothetical protein VHO67_06310 [Polyangia bacterium]|nr:hypothetical protein [Polyangia bacterium]